MILIKELAAVTIFLSNVLEYESRIFVKLRFVVRS